MWVGFDLNHHWRNWARDYWCNAIKAPRKTQMTARPCLPLEDFLARAPLLAGLERPELSRLAEGANQIVVPRGARIYGRGDPCNGLYVVVYGQIKLALHSSQGIEKVVELAGPGRALGCAALFADRPHAVTAETLGDSRLVHIPRTKVLTEIDHLSPVARRFLTTLAERALDMLSEVEAGATQTSMQRLANYLDSTARRWNGDAARSARLPASKTIIASRLSMTKETLSRLLRELAERGAIAVNRDEILVLDGAALARYAARPALQVQN